MDLYSLAVVLYQLVADVPPFQAGSTAEPKRLRKLDPSVPAELERLVAAALARDPFERPQTAEIMAASLCAVAEQLHAVQSMPKTSIIMTVAPISAPLAASATAAAGAIGASRTHSPAEVTASAAPKPALESEPTPARPTSQVTRIDPNVPLPAAPLRVAPSKTDEPKPAAAMPPPIDAKP